MKKQKLKRDRHHEPDCADQNRLRPRRNRKPPGEKPGEDRKKRNAGDTRNLMRRQLRHTRPIPKIADRAVDDSENEKPKPGEEVGEYARQASTR